jgi:hypothetical protein
VCGEGDIQELKSKCVLAMALLVSVNLFCINPQLNKGHSAVAYLLPRHLGIPQNFRAVPSPIERSATPGMQSVKVTELPSEESEQELGGPFVAWGSFCSLVSLNSYQPQDWSQSMHSDTVLVWVWYTYTRVHTHG